nr:hypothetical protein [Tanacetum cinerariifolium]
NGVSYTVPANSPSTTTTDTTSGDAGTKSGRTVTLTVEDIQKKKNDVKARTTLLLSLPDEHQLRLKNSFEVLKLLENSVEVLKILENKLESMKILENKLDSLKLQENQPENLAGVFGEEEDQEGNSSSEIETLTYHVLATYGNKMYKAFPLPVIEFSLAKELPTASEESCHCQKKSEATAVKIALLSKRITFNPHITSTFHTHQEMDQQYPTVTKIPILDTRKFEQWQFRIQQYLQREHYALWEVIEFGDSYEVPESTTTTDTTSGETGTKSRITVTLTAEDMQKKKNDTFNRLQVIVDQLQFMDVKVEQDDLNQKFLTSLAPEWLMHTIVWRNKSDLDTISLDDLYNHLKVFESDVQKKSEPNSQNMAFISSAKHSSGSEDGNTACVLTASTNVPTASASVATISQDTACAYIASQSSGSQIKFENINQIDEDDMEDMDIKWNMALLSMRADKF